MATITVAEFAEAIDTTAREARKFLRMVTPDDAQPGKGGRWAIEKRDVRSLKTKFAKWEAEKLEAKEAAAAADEAPDEEEIIDADEPTDADIEALAAELED